MEAAREAQLMSSRLLPPKMALPPRLELGHGLMQVPVHGKREREAIWASRFLHFLLNDMGVTHPVLGENLVWWPCPAQRDSGKCNL